ncbi:hypothetical protein RIR_jg21105.t1 [Rhizophagus irregularis DAOM 181602=DAOM 197198]|nr:hypothetical protein RIR_jg21105.t1 [Rhizophagus irregularis DAOM 181602=DAOM 197198]
MFLLLAFKKYEFWRLLVSYLSSLIFSDIYSVNQLKRKELLEDRIQISSQFLNLLVLFVVSFQSFQTE